MMENDCRIMYTENVLITYDCKTKQFLYPEDAGEQFGGEFDQRPLWQIMKEEGSMDEEQAERLQGKVLEIAGSDKPEVFFAECCLFDATEGRRRYRIGFVAPVPGDKIYITFTDVEDEVQNAVHCGNVTETDELTGLMTKKAFYIAAKDMILNHREAAIAGEYAFLHFDVIRFKAINDIFGREAGDRVLMYIAQVIRENLKEGDIACRQNADRFQILTHASGKELEALVEKLLDTIAGYQLPFEIACNVGIYVTGSGTFSVDSMVDRAVLAQSLIKGSYTKKYNYYKEEFRDRILGELEIAGMMNAALAENQFVVYYQPQYSHTTGLLVGAEALVRWKHPARGLIAPGLFIPIFEKNGFIVQLDFYVFEKVCAFIRYCLDQKYHVVPISSNFCRNDIFYPEFVETLEKIREKYCVPAKYLRVEITESSAVDNPKYTNEIIRKLHEKGYIVEMDDFGSGYSSLNVLKDIDLDVIKLDMLFMSQESESKRGGTILSSIIRMAKWLGMPVIAEGVETTEQADFLRSIGCDCIQGYLYSKPLPQHEFEEILSSNFIGTKVAQSELIKSLDANNFWDAKSLETLIFSNYVGGAAIFDYQNGNVEILRVNQKYLQELGMNLSEKDIISSDFWKFFDEANAKEYKEMLSRAMETEEEQECETWRDITSDCCGKERFCIRCNVRMIGKSDDSVLFYAMIRNITNEKQFMMAASDNERRFRMASEQINIYFWEYSVATHEMHPCFRCMRDLGLPALVQNYPEPLIEACIFPPEIADEYREWIRQIDSGEVSSKEGVVPLTVGRIPFRVRLTSECDETGRPVKVYGSAALIVD